MQTKISIFSPGATIDFHANLNQLKIFTQEQRSHGINCHHLTIENVFAPKNVSASKFNFGLPKVAKL